MNGLNQVLPWTGAAQLQLLSGEILGIVWTLLQKVDVH